MFRHKRRSTRKISSTVIAVLIAVALIMGIGYAAISTTLNIDGTSDIDSASWDVHFANVQVTSGSVSATTPTISNNTSVSFSANLANPGDFYEFTVDVINDGTLDAKLDEIEILPVLDQTQSNYFNYTVTYEDGVEISENDKLDAGQTEKISIKFNYLKQNDTSLYPTDDTNFNFSVSMTYVQGHGNQRDYCLYFPDYSAIDWPLDVENLSNATFYDNYNDFINNFGHNFFLKHLIRNDTIKSTQLGFFLNGRLYYLYGAGESYSPSTYSNNKKVLDEAFGASNCSTVNDYYNCSLSGISVGISDTGLNIYEDSHFCYIFSLNEGSGYSYCGNS